MHQVQTRMRLEPRDIQPPDDVVVPAVHISGKDARDQSRFAYWVADEGTKSKVNFHEDPSQQYPNATSEEIVSRLPLLSPRSNPLLDDPAARQLLTPGLLHASDAEIDEDQDLKHHYTTYSKGVLADMARGGLKKDLSRGLGDQFPEKLAGKVMWQEALPMRGPDGKILNLDVYQKKPELAVDKRKMLNSIECTSEVRFGTMLSLGTIYIYRDPPSCPASMEAFGSVSIQNTMMNHGYQNLPTGW